jgi:hypothetical protein
MCESERRKGSQGVEWDKAALEAPLSIYYDKGLNVSQPTSTYKQFLCRLEYNRFRRYFQLYLENPQEKGEKLEVEYWPIFSGGSSVKVTYTDCKGKTFGYNGIVDSETQRDEVMEVFATLINKIDTLGYFSR